MCRILDPSAVLFGGNLFIKLSNHVVNIADHRTTQGCPRLRIASLDLLPSSRPAVVTHLIVIVVHRHSPKDRTPGAAAQETVPQQVRFGSAASKSTCLRCATLALQMRILT